MTDTAVPRFPGVHRRPDSTLWAFGLRTPRDLLHRFDRKPWAVRCSLGTSDLREANEKAAALQAEWLQRFAAMRLEDNPQTVSLTPALVASVAAEVRRWVLQADDNARDSPGFPQALLVREERRRLLAAVAQAQASPLAALLPLQPSPQALAGLTIAGAASAPPPVPVQHDPLAGLSENQAGALERFNAATAAGAAVDMARRNLKETHALAVAVSRSLGWQADWLIPEGKAGLLEVQKAERQARADVLRRDAGEVVDTPPLSVPQQCPQEAAGATHRGKKRHTTQDAFDAWSKGKPGKPPRPDKSVKAYKHAAGKLAEMLKGRPLEDVNREVARQVVQDLLTEAAAKGGGAAQNTAANHLDRFKTLLAAAQDMEWVEKNPFHKMTIARLDPDRDEWSLPELVRLFDDPLFTAYRLPAEADAGQDAAYWLPLLGLFTGARVTELAQLHTEDLQHTEEAGWVLSIKADAAKGQRVKTARSAREVPVHPELERLGLMDYWRAIKALGAGPMWPVLTHTHGKLGKLSLAGTRATHWFSDYKTAKGFGRDRVFHSFRHTLENRLKAAEVLPYMIARLQATRGRAQGTARTRS